MDILKIKVTIQFMFYMDGQEVTKTILKKHQ